MKTLLLFLIWLLLAPGRPVVAADSLLIGGLAGIDPHQPGESYSVLMAVSGGGARGLSTIGVLKAFEEKNIQIRGLSGTSMGGVVGGLYACGYSPDQLQRLILSIDFPSLFSNRPERSTILQTRRQDRDHHLLGIRFDKWQPYIPRGLTAAQRITELLSSLTNKANYLADRDYRRFPIPFVTVSTDLVSGRLVEQTHGSLADAMRATMAFPLAFTAVEQDSMLLMDGGMLAPIPVEQVRSLTDSVTYVVAINTTSPLLTKEKLTSPIDVANQVTTIMAQVELERQLLLADYVIVPDIDSFSASDFDDREALIELGYRAGLTAADSIISQLQTDHVAKIYTIAEVSIEGVEADTAASVSALLLGRALTRPALVSLLKQLCLDNSWFEVRTRILATPSAETGQPERTELHLDVTPGLRGHELKVTIDGNTIYSDSLLLATMTLPGNAVTAVDVRRAIDRVVNQYSVDGFDLADVSLIQVDPVANSLRIVIDEGYIYRVDVVNNERSRDWLIRSYFTLSRNEPFSTEKAMRGVANIYGTDLYDRVTIDLLPHPEGVIVQLGVVERKPTQLRFGWHWVDEYQSEQFVEFLDDNILGIGLSALAHARFGKDRWNYYTQVKVDRIFSTYFTALMRSYYTRVERPLFDNRGSKQNERIEEKYGVRFQIGQQIARLGTLTGGISFTESKWEDPNGNKTKIGLRSLFLESLVETFDRYPFPNKGNRYLMSLELTGKVFGGETEFTRFFSSVETFLPLGNYFTYHPGMSIGISRSGLPPTEKFYSGGVNQFTGYQTDELSGDKILLINQELRVRLPLRLYAMARYDFGDVYSSTDQIKLENLRHGFGLSLALDSPLGPIQFGWGAADAHDDEFYFNAGLAF